jgi:hypothetical protein
MNKNRILITCLALLVVFVVFVALTYAQKTEPSNSAAGRYQLVSSQVLYQSSTAGQGDFPGPAVFLLDAQTGQIGEYQSTSIARSPEGKITHIFGSNFVPVGWVREPPTPPNR